MTLWIIYSVLVNKVTRSIIISWVRAVFGFNDLENSEWPDPTSKGVLVTGVNHSKGLSYRGTQLNTPE